MGASTKGAAEVQTPLVMNSRSPPSRSRCHFRFTSIGMLGSLAVPRAPAQTPPTVAQRTRPACKGRCPVCNDDRHACKDRCHACKDRCHPCKDRCHPCKGDRSLCNATGRAANDAVRAANTADSAAKLCRSMSYAKFVDEPLPTSFRDHPLAGTWTGFRDCHLAGDWLSIYALPDAHTLLLVRTGSHCDLFG